MHGTNYYKGKQKNKQTNKQLKQTKITSLLTWNQAFLCAFAVMLSATLPGFNFKGTAAW